MAPNPSNSRRSRPAGAVAVLALSLAAALAGCGGGAAPGTPPAPAVVTADQVVSPGFALTGCTYQVNGTVPVGEPTGLRPHFASFAPDAAAAAAVASLRSHGGTAMVDGAGLPAGTRLFAGPDTDGTPAGTVPSHRSVLLAEPLVWKAGGDTWLAFFLQCGGPHLYWASLDQIHQVSPGAAATLRALLVSLARAVPFTTSDQASLLPVTVRDHHLVWKSARVSFPVARGQLVAAG